MRRHDLQFGLGAVNVSLDPPSLCAASTKNFSGAELEGLVKAAVSYALNRQVKLWY